MSDQNEDRGHDPVLPVLDAGGVGVDGGSFGNLGPGRTTGLVVNDRVLDHLLVVLNYLLRARTFYEGQRHPPHIESALALNEWVRERKQA